MMKKATGTETLPVVVARLVTDPAVVVCVLATELNTSDDAAALIPIGVQSVAPLAAVRVMETVPPDRERPVITPDVKTVVRTPSETVP